MCAVARLAGESRGALLAADVATASVARGGAGEGLETVRLTRTILDVVSRMQAAVCVPCIAADTVWRCKLRYKHALSLAVT